MAKAQRRRCDNPACERQYTPKRTDSKTCSDRCRKALSRLRRAEEAEAEAQEKRRQISGWLEAIKKRKASAPPAAPPPPPPSPPPSPSPRPAVAPSPPMLPAARVVIRLPKRAPMTPLNWGRRG